MSRIVNRGEFGVGRVGGGGFTSVTDGNAILAQIGQERSTSSSNSFLSRGAIGGDGGGDDDNEYDENEFVNEQYRRTTTTTASTAMMNTVAPFHSSSHVRLVDLVGGKVDMREKISMTDHLYRLLFLLTWSDRHQGQWMGICRFIDAYFSLIFHSYFGKAFNMNVWHVARVHKMCAMFSLMPNFSYTIVVMLNYPLWDKILQTSSSLPNRYFRRSIRKRLADEIRSTKGWQTSGESKNNNSNANTEDDTLDDLEFSRLYNVSLAALALVSQLEESMLPDLEQAGVKHVVTVARFFTGSQTARQPFSTTTLYE